MKTNFSILLFFISLHCLAQTWAPTGATWYYTQTYAASNFIDYIKIESIGDTVINNIPCKILQKNRQSCDFRPAQEFMYNDAGKVYFYDFVLHQFQLLYDFDAKPGDTWKIIMDTTVTPVDTIFFVVDSVSSMLINNKTQKVLNVFYYINAPYQANGYHWSLLGNGKIIEAIGDVRAMFPWFYGSCDLSYSSGLRCYQDTVIGFYSTNTASACDYVTSISNITGTNLKIEIFPNPATDMLTLKNIFNSINYQIYNCTGQEVMSGNLRNEEQIPIGELSSGLYMLKSFTSTNIYYNKFLKL